MTALPAFSQYIAHTMQTELNVTWAPDISKNIQWRDQKMSPGGRHQVQRGENAQVSVEFRMIIEKPEIRGGGVNLQV